MNNIVIIGAGFAGVWAALSAQRQIEITGDSNREFQITVISKDRYLTIRPRLYEKSLEGVQVPLETILNPAGVHFIKGTVEDIDFSNKSVSLLSEGSSESIVYDRLILAAGSAAVLPDIPGLKKHAFSVDTYEEANLLDLHLKSLSSKESAPGQYTVVIVGGGFTGIEIAAEMTARIQELSNLSKSRVVLIDRGPVIGSGYSSESRQVIEEALQSLGVEVITNVQVVRMDSKGIELSNGSQIPTQTVIWSGGIRANRLTELFPVPRDEHGRLPVDASLRVSGLHDVFAAGDVAKAAIDDEHYALMSCQHAIPLGKFAGHNAASELLGLETLEYKQRPYVTCLDLGQSNALLTTGWERTLDKQGVEAKELKEKITKVWIYPPNSGSKEDLLQAASPLQ